MFYSQQFMVDVVAVHRGNLIHYEMHDVPMVKLIVTRPFVDGLL